MNALIINCSPMKDGATALIAEIAAKELTAAYQVKSICIDDYHFAFCRGCRACHKTAQCIINDDIPLILRAFEQADLIVAVSPSYWADIPGQFKAFIDRCTPWCNTHEPHAVIGNGKKGYVIALRTGGSMRECERIIQSIEHFYGHLEIACCGHLGLCGIEYRQQAEARAEEIRAFCREILAQ